MSQRAIDEATLLKLVQLAGYELPAERREMVLGQYNTLLAGFEAFEAYDTKEMPPAHAFTPRWEG